MAIVAISRGSYLRGTEVAVTVADRLAYGCVSRDVLLEASEQFNVPEAMLIRTLDDAPSFLERLMGGKERYVTYIRAALLSRIQAGDVVYHGFAGHLLLQDVQNLLKVRIVADLDDRVGIVVEREGVSEEQARRTVEQADKERVRWSRALYGVDISDASLYHLCLNVSRLSVRGAADLICSAIDHERFQMTPEARRGLDDLVLAARVKAALVEAKPDAEVVADGTHVRVMVASSSVEGAHVLKVLDSLASEVEGVGSVEIDVQPRPSGRRFSQ